MYILIKPVRKGLKLLLLFQTVGTNITKHFAQLWRIAIIADHIFNY